MKTILYMAISANGYIAKSDGGTSWSDDEWKAFSKMVGICGNVVIGKNTYDIMCKYDEFANIGNPFVVVVSGNDLDSNSTNVVCAKSPKQALEILRKQGFKKALVAGGGILNASFLNEDLIDEMYLDVEPVVFTSGIELFVDAKYNKRLKLINVNKVGSDTIQLHYQVLKNN